MKRGLVLILALLATHAAPCLADDVFLGRDLRDWAALRNSDDPATRRHAAATLASAPSIEPALLAEGLTHTDEVVRYWSALALANRARAAATPAEREALQKLLLPARDDSSPVVQANVAYGLADTDRAHVERLVELLDHPQPGVGILAATWLDKLGDAGAPYARRLEAIAQTGSEYPKRLAERMLRRWKGNASP